MRKPAKWYLIGLVVVAVVGGASPVAAAPSDGPSRSQGTPQRGVTGEQRYDLDVEATQGDRTPVVLPNLTRILSLDVDHPDPRAAGLVLAADPRSGVTASVPAALAPGTYRMRAAGSGCAEQVCGISYTLRLTLTVVPMRPAPADVNSFTVASDDRLAAAEPLASGGVALRDELVLTLGTPDQPGTSADAARIADSVGAVVAGGLSGIGVFQLRWTGRPDLAPIRSALEGKPLVAAVARSTYGSVGADDVTLPPSDWNDDGEAVTWPFTQIHAQDAWHLSTGQGVGVGIVDEGTVYREHEDLDVAAVLGREDVGDGHATHVAGLACAVQNGRGVVGSAWGCPITSVGLSYISDLDVLESATRMSQTDVGVVNMSLGWRATNGTDMCVQSTDEAQQIIDDHRAWEENFGHLFAGPDGRDKVWVLSAGNDCSDTVLSPWTLTYDLPNVVTVAATNSDGSLSSFSNFGSGVEVAAPGGVGPGDEAEGLWSTSVHECGFLGWDFCGSYEQRFGTSMAAPLVAGVAALVRSANPDLSAEQVGNCIVATAGDWTGKATTRSIFPTEGKLPINPKVSFAVWVVPIVDAEASVVCGLAGGDPGPAPEPTPTPPATPSGPPPAPGAGPPQPGPTTGAAAAGAFPTPAGPSGGA